MTALRRSLCLALFLCASCLTFKASGQTYVRPSNGQAIQLVQSIPLNSSTNFTSQVFAISSYDALQIMVFTSADPSTCSYQPVVTVYGATSTSGPFTQKIADDHASVVIGSNLDAFYPITNLAPFIEIQITSEAASGNACNVTVEMVPHAFTGKVRVVGVTRAGVDTVPDPVVIGGSRSTNVVEPVQIVGVGSGATFERLLFVTTNSADRTPASAAAPTSVSDTTTLVLTTTTATPSANLQNVGVNPVYCGVATSSSGVSTSSFNVLLKADSTGSAGDGGQWPLKNLTSGTQIYCVCASTKSSSIAVTQF